MALRRLARPAAVAIWVSMVGLAEAAMWYAAINAQPTANTTADYVPLLAMFHAAGLIVVGVWLWKLGGQDHD